MNGSKQQIRKFIKCICEKDFSKANAELELVIAEKIKQRVKSGLANKRSQETSK